MIRLTSVTRLIQNWSTFSVSELGFSARVLPRTLLAGIPEHIYRAVREQKNKTNCKTELYY